ncbi:3253_t:CDS:2 [Gigaspora margarita]|uniref:3253_t:CDS:1 n=1 Tax=Gigaspora margarita TaxID=4874 RepID=A0ABN7URU0_GIGMA|nr:3253_t:CDS:2 [Gigaspora margarita]
MKEKTKIKDIPEGPGKGNIRKSNYEVDFEDKFRMMCVERINKGVESIKRNGTVMTCKPNVDIEKFDKSKKKKCNEVGDVSEDNANVAKTADEAGENGTISELLCSYWLFAGV